MEAPRSRRHSVGVPGRGGVALDDQESGIPTPGAKGSIMPHPDGEQQAGLKSTSSAAAFNSKRRRRQSAGGRRRSKGGGSDFSYSPYQPMVIGRASSSVSPRPRRASAPIPPASLLLHRSLMDGEKRDAAGPTLEQCLVLPPGLALKVDGLLSQPLSKLVGGAESEDGGGSGGGGGGGGGDDVHKTANNKGEGGGLPVERGDGGLHAGDERAIISTYTFERSNSQAVATKEEAAEHTVATDELDPVGDAVVVSDDGPSDTCDGGAEDEWSTTPQEVTFDPQEARSPASREGIDDETTGASAATTVTVAGDEPAEKPVSVGEEPGVLGSLSLGGEDALASDLVGDGNASDDAVMVDLQEEVEFGGDGVDPRSAVSPLTVVDVEPKAGLVDAGTNAGAGGSVTQGRHEKECMLPQAEETEPCSRTNAAACSCETVETVISSPVLETGESLNVDRVGVVADGGGVAAAAGEGEDDYQNDGHVSEEETAERAEAALVEHRDSAAAREERKGRKVGCKQEEESSTSAATEASEDVGDVALEGGTERTGAHASEEMAVGVVVASTTAAATMICNGSSSTGKTGDREGVAGNSEEAREHVTGQAQKVVREGGASGAITAEATATVCSYPATITKEEEEEEKKSAPTSSEAEQKPFAAETTISTSSFAVEVVADAARPPPVEHLESGVEDANGAPSPAVDTHSHVVAVSSVVKAPNVEEEEFPLDWEALAQEVEAEWVMEGSDGESAASLSPASPPVSSRPAPVTEGKPPPYHVAVAVVEASSANSLVRQHKEEEVHIGIIRDGNEPRESARDVLEAPPPTAPTQSHKWEGNSSSSGRDGGGVAFILEDSKEEAEDDFDFDTKKNPADDSDCGSVVPASSEGEAPIPTNEAQVSTQATTRSGGGQQQSSVSIPPTGAQLPEKQVCAMDPMKGGVPRPAARVEPGPAPIRPPIHGGGVAEKVDEDQDNQNVPSTVPVAAMTAEAAPPLSGGHDGGLGLGGSQHPDQESAPREVGRDGGGCAASCGCVVM